MFLHIRPTIPKPARPALPRFGIGEKPWPSPASSTRPSLPIEKRSLLSVSEPDRIRVVTRRRFLVLLGLLALVISAAAATAAPTATTYKLGVYKGTTSQGKPIAFRLAVAVCAPQVRGGNQHQRK